MQQPENFIGANLPHELVGFERIEEYRTVLEHVASVSMRRQNLNSLFVSINVVFLTGIGFLVFSSEYKSYLLPIFLFVISILISPINLIWIFTVRRLSRIIALYYEYVREIEEEHRTLRGSLHDKSIGVALLYNERFKSSRYGITIFEVSIAIYFLILYPVIAFLIYCIILGENMGLLPNIGF